MLHRALAAPQWSAVSAAARGFYRQPELMLVNPPVQWPPDVLAVRCGAPVVSAAFSPDGALLLASAASAAGAVVRYTANGEPAASLPPDAHPQTCSAWSANGSLIATASAVRATPAPPPSLSRAGVHLRIRIGQVASAARRLGSSCILR